MLVEGQRFDTLVGRSRQMESNAMKPTYEFSKKPTPSGCWAIMTVVSVVSPDGRTVKKFFRNGYAHGEISADKWIAEQKEMIEVEALIREGKPIPRNLKFELTAKEADMLLDAESDGQR